MRFVVFLSVLTVAACGPGDVDAGPAVTNDLTVTIVANETGGVCRPEITTTIAEDVPVYMVKGKQKLDSMQGGMVTRFPLQIQFPYAMDNIKKSTSIPLSNYDMACADLTIEWSKVTCQSDDREPMDCPDFVINGADALGNFTIAE